MKKEKSESAKVRAADLQKELEDKREEAGKLEIAWKSQKELVENINKIQEKIGSLKQLELSEKQNLFVEKLSASYEQYGLYSDSVGQLSTKLSDFLNWYAHFLQMSNYLGEIDKNEGLIVTYAQAKDFAKIKAIVTDSQSKISLAKQELDEAEKIIPFPFVVKFKTMFDDYNSYVSSLSSLADSVEKNDADKVIENVNKATEYFLHSISKYKD